MAQAVVVTPATFAKLYGYRADRKRWSVGDETYEKIEKSRRNMDLPWDGPYVRGAVPREYIRQEALLERDADGVMQTALRLGDLAKAEGFNVEYLIDEYNNWGDVVLRLRSPGSSSIVRSLVINQYGSSDCEVLDGSGFSGRLTGTMKEWRRWFAYLFRERHQ